MRAGHLTLPVVALLALAACDNGGSDVQTTPEPPASSSEPGVAGGTGPAGADEASDPGVSGSPDAEGDTSDPGAASGSGNQG